MTSLTAMSRSSSTWARATRAGVVVGVSSALVLSACGLTAGSSEYDYSCPEDSNGDELPLVVLGFLDLSASGRSEPILSERLDTLQVELERVADCEGRATVIGFSDSTASNVVLLDRHFDAEGATEVARDRDIPDAIDASMDDIRANIDGALDRLPADGTDVSAMFVLAADQLPGLGPDTAIEMYAFTDGISTAGSVNLNDPELTPSRAVELADAAVPVDLSRLVRIDVRGIGKVAGDVQPPTDYVAAISAYVTELCRQATGDTNGTKCTVRTITTPR